MSITNDKITRMKKIWRVSEFEIWFIVIYLYRKALGIVIYCLFCIKVIFLTSCNESKLYVFALHSVFYSNGYFNTQHNPKVVNYFLNYELFRR